MIEIIKNFIYNIFIDRAFGIPRSNQWDSVRKSFIENNPFCGVCETRSNLEVHHIKPFHLNQDLELTISNLITLCRDHHYLFGHFLNWSSYNPNVISDVELWNTKIKTRL